MNMPCVIMIIIIPRIQLDAKLTWRELKIVNSHATTVEFALTVRVPNAHVSPRRGSRIRDASRRALQQHYGGRVVVVYDG